MALTKVSTDGVKSNAINTAKIVNGSIQSEDIADNQIITDKILNGAVSLAKLPHGDTNNDGKFLRANNGADPSFESIPAGTTINNNAADRIITGEGGTTLNGESNLTFNGNQLAVTGTSTVVGQFNGASIPTVQVSQTTDSTDLQLRANSTGGLVRTASNTPLVFGTNQTERMRIDSSGRLLIGSTDGATYADGGTDDLIVGSTANGKNDGITILSGTAQNGQVAFADSGGATQGLVGYVHNGDYLRFHAGNTLKARIDTDGLKFNSDNATANALDDYEEGTFVPDFANVSNSDITVNRATYTKIGRLVHFECKFTVSSSDGSRFGFSLPVAQAGSRETVIPAISTRSGSNTAPFAFVVNANQSYAYGYELDGFGDSQTAYSTFSGDVVLISGTYEAA